MAVFLRDLTITERVIPHDGDIYYDFKDLISAIWHLILRTFFLGREISSRNVKLRRNGKSYISNEFLKENYLVQMIMLHSIFDLEYPLFLIL